MSAMIIPALRAYIETLAGGACNIVVSQVSIGAASTQVLSNNFERMAAAIINTSAANITVVPGIAATVTSGVQLGANGGGITLNAQQDLALVGWNWNAIPSAGTVTITVMEVIRVSATADPPS